MIDYKEIPEHAADAAVLKYWHIVSDSAVEEQHNRLFPYGCAEIILPISGSFKEYGADEPLQHGAVYLLGPLKLPARVSVEGKLDAFGIRIAVGRLPLLLNIDTSTVVQHIQPWPQLAFLSNLTTDLQKTDSLEERAHIVRTIISEHTREATEDERKLFEAIDYIIANHGKCTVEYVAELAGVSKRGLERKFQYYVGVSPKWFIRMMRLKYVLDASKQLGDRSRIRRMTDIAMQAGFYDQAHFIKDFRSWMKETPVAFFQKHTQRITGSFYRTTEEKEEPEKE